MFFSERRVVELLLISVPILASGNRVVLCYGGALLCAAVMGLGEVLGGD